MQSRALLLAIGIIIFVPLLFVKLGTQPGVGLAIGVIFVVAGLIAWKRGAPDDG